MIPTYTDTDILSGRSEAGLREREARECAGHFEGMGRRVRFQRVHGLGQDLRHQKGAFGFEKIDRIGGKHPGSALCKKHLKAKVVISKSLNGGTKALCLLEDKSIISLSTLYYYWRNNQ